MKIEKNKSLKNLNTFGVNVSAKFFVELNDVSELSALLALPEFQDEEILFLGGGSNVLFTKDFDGLVIKNNLRGIKVLKENDDHIWLRAMSGENWHALVMYAVERGWGGFENLSLIPGTVGAAPVQNIGAYGAELKDTLESVEAVSLKDGSQKIFSNKECKFGYRTSVFKTSMKGEYFITAAVFRLDKTPKLNITYGGVQAELEAQGIQEPTIVDVSNAVIAIRQNKLPYPKEIGNAGSFFKNPHISKELFARIRSEYPDMPFYELPDDLVKIPAAWLIETAGWKGKRVGNTGSHEKQALVLVNYGGATGAEIAALARDIQNSVEAKFHITLEPEVTII